MRVLKLNYLPLTSMKLSSNVVRLGINKGTEASFRPHHNETRAK
jgi:hypothetical protein